MFKIKKKTHEAFGSLILCSSNSKQAILKICTKFLESYVLWFETTVTMSMRHKDVSNKLV